MLLSISHEGTGVQLESSFILLRSYLQIFYFYLQELLSEASFSLTKTSGNADNNFFYAIPLLCIPCSSVILEGKIGQNLNAKKTYVRYSWKWSRCANSTDNLNNTDLKHFNDKNNVYNSKPPVSYKIAVLMYHTLESKFKLNIWFDKNTHTYKIILSTNIRGAAFFFSLMCFLYFNVYAFPFV